MFKFMAAIEMMVKGYMKREDKPREIKSELVKLIKECESVQCCWEVVSAEWDLRCCSSWLLIFTRKCVALHMPVDRWKGRNKKQRNV